MFEKARLKLTGYYLIIIMAVSLGFSALVYRTLDLEIQRFSRLQILRLQQNFLGPDLLYQEPVVDPDLIEETHHRILLVLGVINAAILVGAGFLGYYLADRTLEPIQEMLDQQYRFISDASHELKTPITSMRTNLEVNLREKKLTTKEAKTVLADNLAEVINLQHLSEGLLELSNGEKPLDLKPLEIGSVIITSVREVKPLAAAKNITIQVSGPAKARVKADALALKRVLVALLDNAIKYSSNGKTIEINVKKSRTHVQLSMIDHGIGIAKKDLPHLTERFYRSDLSRSSDGHGLGLAIVDKIVKSHHGKLTISSQINQGTKVTVLLPSPSKP